MCGSKKFVESKKFVDKRRDSKKVQQCSHSFESYQTAELPLISGAVLAGVLSLLIFSIVLEILASAVRQEREIKCI